MSSEAPTQIIPLPPRRRRRRTPAVVLLLAAGLAGAAAVVVLRAGGHPAGAAADPGPSVRSAPLVRQDLSTTQSLPGTLGFGTARPVAGGGAGIVTWMPQPGAVVRRGQQLYRVDDRPVQLFYGGMPLFRALGARNTVGRDVRVVADNLRALGYSIGRQPKAVTATPTPGASSPPSPPPAPVKVRTGESVLTDSMIAAIKRWQRDNRLPETGAVAPADVVVQVGAVRVDTVSAQPGVAAEGELMAVTPTDKVITVLADVDESAGVDAGDQVTVGLPGGHQAPGKVVAVGTELKRPDGGTGDAPPRRTVTVALNDPKVARGIDAADVDVGFAGETRKNVLVAPITALLALSEGGYALQVAGGPLVAVETGMFAKGLVEVSGTGLAEGTRVVTTS